MIDRAANQNRQADMPVPRDSGRETVTDRDLTANASRYGRRLRRQR
jgi:hypothetical protein